ncbi:HDOD domain-containing protein [Congregibacter sp.]|uniref:HDOD domain-containing protein n=1 Tax=Congregibacter sp. TaxID=2744308 RepID=UPI003F6A9E86
MSWFKRSGKKNSAPPPEALQADTSAAAATSAQNPVETSPGDRECLENLAERKPPDALADLFLVMEEHLNELELEDIRLLVATLRQPPPLVELLSSSLDDPEELREAILSSPTLSADVLPVVNSAAFALNSPISSIEHAVAYLGTTMVRGLVLQSAVGQVMAFETDVQKAAYMRIWRSSYVASAAAQAYASALNFEPPSVHATRALLVNIGDLALISARPELSVIYAPKTDLLGKVEAQQEDFMANSAVLSSLLVRQWGLPEDLCESLRHSLTPLTWAPDSNERSVDRQREDVVVYLACRIGDAVAYGGLKDVADFDLLAEESPDFFYLPDYLRRLELGGLLRTLADRSHGRRVQQIIDTFGA